MSAGAFYQIWAAVGPLADVALGAWLSQRWQHKRWILDNKVLEYRHLLDAFGMYRRLALRRLYDTAGGGFVAVDPKDAFADRERLSEAETAVSNSIASRLFVRKAMAQGDAAAQFVALTREVSNADLPITEGIKKLEDFRARVVHLAESDLSLSKCLRRKQRETRGRDQPSERIKS